MKVILRIWRGQDSACQHSSPAEDSAKECVSSLCQRANAKSEGEKEASTTKSAAVSGRGL